MAMSTLDVQHAAIGAKRPIALLRCSQSLLVTGLLQYLPKDTKELPQWEGPWFSSLHCCGCVVTVDVFAGQNCRIVLVQVPALAHISDDNLGKLTSLVANQSFGLWQINPLTGSPKAAGSANPAFIRSFEAVDSSWISGYVWNQDSAVEQEDVAQAEKSCFSSHLICGPGVDKGGGEP